MLIKGFSRSLISLTLASTISFTALGTAVAGQCKGLEESACQANQTCAWVSAYTTKNGNSVSAYCRAASSKAKKEMNNKEEAGLKSGANDRAKPAAATMNNKEENRG